VSDTPIEERRFTDGEVREILKRAVERTSSRDVAKREGVSLAELQAIGSEVGISPARLAEAARSVVDSGLQRPNPFLGSPTLLSFERRVPRVFDPDDAPQILGAIRRTMGVQGEAAEIRGSLEWSAKGEVGERHVSVSAKDAVTTIRASANLKNVAVATFLPAGMVGVMLSMFGFIVAAEEGSLGGMVLFLMVLPVLYATLRRILRRVTEREAARLERVLDDLESLTLAAGAERVVEKDADAAHPLGG